MNIEYLKKQWEAEERIAHIKGWDFSHLQGRYEEGQDLPWNYAAEIRKYLRPDHRLLDIDTGGGEFLLSLKHPYKKTSAIEGYPPNVDLCRSVLLPLGIDFREAQDVSRLPFDDNSFDRVINRHGDFDTDELFRILKPGGLFITQQVGAENERALVDLLLPGLALPYPEQYVEKAAKRFMDSGFKILEAREAFPKIRFYDVGALVWFARIIEWEFPGFSVDACLDQLCKAQRIVEENGMIEAVTHRYLLVALKPDVC